MEDTHLPEEMKDLKQAWINEMTSPDILPFQKPIISYFQEQIQSQETNLKHAQQQMNDPEDKFVSKLYEAELSRIEYLVQSYFKQRILKIQNNIIYLMNNQEKLALLSESELKFAKKYFHLFSSHLHHSFLHLLPQGKLQSTFEPHMIPNPNLDEHVFVRILHDVGDFQFQDDEIIVNLQKGDIYLLKYKNIIPLLENGRLELV